MPFASVSQSRISTGRPLAFGAALDPLGAAAVLLPWLLALGFSLVGAGDRRFACARGLAASGAVAGLLWASGRAAPPALADAGAYARYSLGAAVWVSGFAALTLIIAARRECGARTLAGRVVTLVAPAAAVALGVSGHMSDLGISVEYRNLGARFWTGVGQHVAYSAISMVVATALGVWLGVLAFRHPRMARPIFGAVSVFQTMPGLALVGILVAPLAAIAAAMPGLRAIGFGGLGWAPVLIALTLYALLAIVRNTYVGLKSVPASAVEAGLGMGMTERQLLMRVQAPLALPIVFSGIRTASQQTVGNATLGAFVAAGGLGPVIFLGLAQQAYDLVLLGSIALVLLALTIDGVMRGVQDALGTRAPAKVTP